VTWAQFFEENPQIVPFCPFLFFLAKLWNFTQKQTLQTRHYVGLQKYGTLFFFPIIFIFYNDGKMLATIVCHHGSTYNWVSQCHLIHYISTVHFHVSLENKKESSARCHVYKWICVCTTCSSLQIWVLLL
jgi:hypothetical protein